MKKSAKIRVLRTIRVPINLNKKKSAKIRVIRTIRVPINLNKKKSAKICVIRIIRVSINLNMKKHLILFAIIFALIIKLSAQTYSNEFLAIGVGARAHGMSGAVAATTNDLYASYWNPAGLTQMEAPFQIGVMHAEWFGGVAKYDFGGFAKPIGTGAKKRVIALSLIRLGIDQIPYTLNLVGADGSINYGNVSQFSAADYAVQMTYAQELTPNLSIGGSIRRELGDTVAAQIFLYKNALFQTLNSSLFNFNNLPNFQNYEVKPYRNDKPLQGVTTFDIALISRHILGIEPLSTPHKIIAADANHDGEVDATDMLLLRKLILRQIDTLPNNTDENGFWELLKT